MSAEEGGAGKAFLQREGVFNEADVCFTWHPFDITVGSTSTLASASIFYRFKGISSHAAVAPHLGRSALDSVELMNVGVNYLREHMIDEARIHYAVTNTGGNSPNVVQANAEVLYSVRAPQNDQLVDLLERVNNIAKGAALMSGTEVKIEIVSAYADVVQNKVLDQLTYKHIKELYPLNLTAEELEYMEKFYKLGDRDSIGMYQKLASTFIGEEATRLFEGPMAMGYFPPVPKKMGSTDVGDVSWNIPTAWFSGQTFALGTQVHTWQAVAQGKSSVAHKGMKAAATVIARAGVDIFNNPELVERAKEDLENALNGRKYKSIIPEDITPGMLK